MISNNLLEFASRKYCFNMDTLVHIPRNSGKVENIVYSFHKNEKSYILKFEPPCAQYNNQISETKAAMDFNYYLAQNGVSVSVPIKTIDGELVTGAQSEKTDYIITAFAQLSGHTWGYDGKNDKMTFNWGKTMGDMHNAAKSYVPKNKYDVQRDITNSFYWGSFFDNLKAYPSVYAIAQELLDDIRVLPRDNGSFGVIHCDLHQGNFFADGDNISVIDFGDSVYGWYALDAAISLCHALWWGRFDDAGNNFTNGIIENFIKGYLSANPLSDFWISKIPMFMKYRHLCMNPVKNGLGCNVKEWVYNIENDILFDNCDLKTISNIIETSYGDIFNYLPGKANKLYYANRPI